MNTQTLLLHHIIVFIAAGIFISTFVSVSLSMIPQLLVLGTIILLTSLSFSTPRVLYKKNLLRISALLSIIIFIVSVIGRSTEIIDGVFCISCIILTLLYLCIFIIEIIMLKQLYKLVQELF